MLKVVLGILLSMFVSVGFAGPLDMQPLPSDQAFVFTTFVDEHNAITFQWNIAPGYYLYRNKLNFTLSPMGPLKVGDIEWPKSEMKKAADGAAYSIYSGLLKVTVPLIGSYRGPLTLKINYQGCSFGGFCYTPVQKFLNVNLAEIKPNQDLTGNVTLASMNKPVISDQDMAGKIFVGHSLAFIIMSFLGLGLLLAFTPCVLPMIPIVSAIVVGQGRKITTLRAFSLSLSYVLGMAVTYAIVGVMVALIGGSIQTLFQKSWVIEIFSGLFVLLALSLFGYFEIQLPNRWQNKVHRLSNKQEGGTYLGVFLMGCLSTLILSPCISAPLVGVLAYIARSGDVVLGATALLALGIGMGVPLLLIGTSAGKWLPKAGPWMDLIKKIFGILMLGTAIWMLERVISGRVTMFLWSMLAIGSGIYLGVYYKSHRRALFRISGTLLLVYGVILLVGVWLGATDPLHPWGDGQQNKSISSQQSYFTVLQSMDELDQQLIIAKQKQMPVIIDFYAKWCVACVFADKHVLNRVDVRKELDQFVRLRADVTKNDEFDKAIMQRFRVIAPPTMIFFNTQGVELTTQQIVGDISVKKLIQNLETIKEPQRAK